MLLVASLAVPALLCAVAAWQNREVLFEEAANQAQRTSGILEQQAAATLQLYGQVFDRVEENLATNGGADPEKLHAFLAKLDKQLDQVDSIFVVEADGRVTNHSGSWPMPEGVSASGRDYFEILRPAGSGPVSIGEPVVGRLSGKPRLNIAHRRSLPGGGFAGIVAISVSQGYFEDFHRTLRAGPTDTMTLIRDDGTILVRSPPPPPGARQAYPADFFGKVIATADRGTYQTTSLTDRIERIYAYRKLKGYPIYVAYGLDTAGVRARWHRNLALYGAIGVPAALVLFAVTWIALVRARREELAALRLDEEMRHRGAAEDALRQAQKMEAVGQLTGGVAHDFNNLLTVIAGNIELAVGHLVNEPVRRRLEAGLKAVERGQRLTRQLLAFSRRRPLRTVMVDLRQKLPELVNLIGPAVGRDVSLRVAAAPDLWPVEIDDGELQVALLNLAINARDAMANGGLIEISARNVALPESGRPPALQGLAGDAVALAVADEGNGIAPEIIGRVFEPFFTTKAEGKGSGLGLAQVYGFAKQSNGAVTVDSEVGRGTIFTLYLPRAAAQRAAEAASPDKTISTGTTPGETIRPPMGSAAGAGPTGGAADEACRILLVEDDADVAEMAGALLAQLGYRVTVADRARKALAILEEDPRHDLVFSDVVMPDGMSGIELAAEIAHLRPDLPVLLTSGYAWKERLAAAAGHDVLPKPYTMDALKAALEKSLRPSRSPAARA